MSARVERAALIAAVLCAAGCTLPGRIVLDDSGTDVVRADAVDARPDAVDAASDAVDAVDAGSDAVDVAMDAQPDDALDAGMDAAPDALDAAMDAPDVTDAPDVVDTGPEDAYSSTVVAPRPISPPSGSIQTGNNVTLEWRLPAGTTGAIVEFCANRACTTPVTRTPAAGATTLALTGSPLHPQWNYWRVRGTAGGRISATPSPTWQLYVPPVPTSTRHAGHYGAVLDYDGDGIPDVAIGDGASSVFVFRGSTTGYDYTTPAITLTHAATPNFGAIVASAGDVDGNGFADLLVVAQGTTTSSGGTGANVLVYRSDGTGYPGAPDVVHVNSTNVKGASWAGDVNHDGYADVVVSGVTGPMIGHPSGEWDVLLGSASPITTATEYPNNGAGDIMGSSGVGDVDGDGYDDFALAAGTYSIGFGPSAGFVIAGGATLSDTPALTFAEPVSEHFNGTIAGGCDFDGDGWPDVAFGLAGASTGVQRYHSAGSGAVAMPSLDSSLGNTDFVRAVACGGDINGDGYDDAVFTLPSTTAGAATVHVMSGPHAAATSANFHMLTSSTSFGYALAVLGDFDGDGLADVAIGGGNGSVVVSRGAMTAPYLDTSGFSAGTIDITGNAGFGVTVALAERPGAAWWRAFAR